MSCSLVIIACVMIILIVVLYLTKQHHKSQYTEFFDTSSQSDTNLVKYNSKEAFEYQVNISSYFNHMSAADLSARSTVDSPVTSAEHYKNNYLAGFLEFSNEEKSKLNDIVLKANNMLVNYPNFRDTEWKFAKISKDLEYGMPHTIGDMIVITSEFLGKQEEYQVKTLIHEKVHVFQRIDNTATRELVGLMGFKSLTPEERRNISHDTMDRRRSNPDIDNNMYKHEETNQVLVQLYNTLSPSSLVDSKAMTFNINDENTLTPVTNMLLGIPDEVHCQLEHPFEIMACLIAECITNAKFVEDHDGNQYVVPIMNWLRKHYS